MAAPRSGLRAVLRAAFVLLASILFTVAAWGQTTSGSSSAGATVYTAQCTACHTTPTNPYPAQQNGANAGFVIKAAVDAGMGPPSLTATEYADLGAYIATFVPASSSTQAVGQPSCSSSRISAPQPRMRSNQGRAKPRNASPRANQASTSGSRRIALGKRKRSVAEGKVICRSPSATPRSAPCSRRSADRGRARARPFRFRP